MVDGLYLLVLVLVEMQRPKKLLLLVVAAVGLYGARERMPCDWVVSGFGESSSFSSSSSSFIVVVAHGDCDDDAQLVLPATSGIVCMPRETSYCSYYSYE